MKLQLKRFKDDGETTLGVFYIKGVAQCFMIEDQEQTRKVWGEMRIPNGVFNVSLRAEGGFHGRYKTKFGQTDGMLCVHNAPDWKIIVGETVFQYVLIHIGNDDDDTAGCLLPNTSVSFGSMKGSSSTTAYNKIYPIIHSALKRGEKVTIEVTDIEEGK